MHLNAGVRPHKENSMDAISLAGAYQGLKTAKDILTVVVNTNRTVN